MGGFGGISILVAKMTLVRRGLAKPEINVSPSKHHVDAPRVI